MKYITTVRGLLKDTDEKQAQTAHDAAVDKLSPVGRPLGSIGHQAYLNPQNRRLFLAVDTWNNLEGLQKFLSDPNTAAGIGSLFDGQPDITVWIEAGWRSFSE